MARLLPKLTFKTDAIVAYDASFLKNFDDYDPTSVVVKCLSLVKTFLNYH